MAKGTKIQLTIEQKDLLKMGSFLTTNEPRRNYYYFPFWIEEDPETKECWVLNWNNLPENLKGLIKEERNGSKDL